ncbi:hypothetical protein [Marinicellulosiphila megalodicopiae]|uniref:hypothetical protein n=1 Tax=Marinicellulosiphila megalodicopiae TaxID=2724896 RepID=UPI003BB01773
MHNLTRTFLLASLFISPLCFAQSVVEKATQLIQENKFSEAKNLILSVNSSESEYRELQKVLVSITPAQEAFVDGVIAEANLYFRNRTKDYGKAINILTVGLKELPNHPKLKEAFVAVDVERKVEAQKQRQEILLNHGRYLLDVAQFEKTVKDLYPNDPIVQARFEQFLVETQNVANQLSVQAQQLLKMEDIQLAVAHSSALLAYQLDPSDRITQIYTNIDQQMKSRIADIEAAQSEQMRERSIVEINYLSDQFSIELSTNNITEARRILKELQSFGVDVVELDKKIERKINQIVQRALDRGNVLWSEGRIEDALAKWLEVQQYGRDNRVLNNNIAKAQSFIAYYNEVKLKNSQ